MYVGYFFNSNRKYQYKINLTIKEKCLEIAMLYRDIVPFIMFTEADESILEVENGKIIHPKFSIETLSQLKKIFIPFPSNLSFSSVLKEYIDKTELCNDVSKFQKTLPMLHLLELHVLATAARDNVNLNSVPNFKSLEEIRYKPE